MDSSSPTSGGRFPYYTRSP